MYDTQSRIYHLRGTSFDVGYALGQKLGDPVEQNIARYLREFSAASSKFVIDWDRLHHSVAKVGLAVGRGMKG